MPWGVVNECTNEKARRQPGFLKLSNAIGLCPYRSMGASPRDATHFRGRSMTRKSLLTTDAARAWLQATEQQRALEETRTREMIVDRVLRDVMQRVGWGYTVQDSCDETWRKFSRSTTAGVRQLVSQSLEAIGWVRRAKGSEN